MNDYPTIHPANDARLTILTQSTPVSEIRWRKGRGGEQAYVDHAYVTRLLNQAFGWDWDFEADNESVVMWNEKPFEARCRGRLTVRVGDRTIVKVQFGSQPIEFMKDGSAPVSVGDAFKGAASDALKKCASLLGIALDLYDSDSGAHEHAKQEQRQQQRSGNQARQAVSGSATALNSLKALWATAARIYGLTYRAPDGWRGKQATDIPKGEIDSEIAKVRADLYSRIDLCVAVVADAAQKGGAMGDDAEWATAWTLITDKATITDTDLAGWATWAQEAANTYEQVP